MPLITQNSQKEEKSKLPIMEIGFVVVMVIFAIMIIASSKSPNDAASGICGWGFILFICYICCKYAEYSKKKEDVGQHQQQQQVIQIGTTEAKPMRVCPKCGMQNDRESRYCSDCGNTLRT